MTPTARMKHALALPKVSSSDVLEALGLEHRRSRARKLFTGLGIATVGALMGACAVVVSAVMLGAERKGTATPHSVTNLDSAAA